MNHARYLQVEWREVLLRMKAGVIRIVAIYIFWIYHEESEGQWDWTGQRACANLSSWLEALD